MKGGPNTKMNEELTRKALLDLGCSEKEIDDGIAAELARRDVRKQNKKHRAMCKLLYNMVT